MKVEEKNGGNSVGYSVRKSNKYLIVLLMTISRLVEIKDKILKTSFLCPRFCLCSISIYLVCLLSNPALTVTIVGVSGQICPSAAVAECALLLRMLAGLLFPNASRLITSLALLMQGHMVKACFDTPGLPSTDTVPSPW